MPDLTLDEYRDLTLEEADETNVIDNPFILLANSAFISGNILGSFIPSV